MKKLLYLTAILIQFGLNAKAQTVLDVIRTPVTPASGSSRNNRAVSDANLYVPYSLRIPRASAFTLNNAKDSIGYIMFNTTTNRLGVYRGSGQWDSYISDAVADTAYLKLSGSGQFVTQPVIFTNLVGSTSSIAVGPFGSLAGYGITTSGFVISDPSNNQILIKGLSSFSNQIITVPNATGTFTLGTGTTNYLTFWNNANAVTGYQNLQWDATHNGLLIKQIDGSGNDFSIYQTGTTTASTFNLTATSSYGSLVFTAGNSGGYIDLVTTNGVRVSPTGIGSLSVGQYGSSIQLNTNYVATVSSRNNKIIMGSWTGSEQGSFIDAGPSSGAGTKFYIKGSNSPNNGGDIFLYGGVTSVPGSFSNGNTYLAYDGTSNVGKVIIPYLTASKVVFTDASKNLTSTGIGTSSQFIKGDGSLDNTTYLTSASGITGTGTANFATKFTGTNTIGNSIIQDNGTALGLGGLQTATTFNNALSITGATVAYGQYNQGIIQTDVTNTAFYYYALSSTTAGTSISNITLYNASQGSFRSGTTVGSQTGFLAQSGLVGATNNYGFRGSIPSATGRWNLYMDGTAQNYLAGYTGFGLNNPLARVHISSVTASAWGSVSPQFLISGSLIDNSTAAGASVGLTATAIAVAIPSLTASNATVGSPVTYTTAATVYVAGAPSAGANTNITNPYSLYVASGNSYFGNSIIQASANTNTTGGYSQLVRNNTSGRYETSTIDLLAGKTTVADANYTALVSDYLISYTSLTATRTVTLVALATNQIQVIKDEVGTAGTNNIVINAPAGKTIDGASSKTINTNYGSLKLYYNGTNFFTTP